MARLPIPGQDSNQWGIILNDFLKVAHNPNGTVDASTIDVAQLDATQIDVTQLNLPAAALSGSYNDLADKPTIPSYNNIDLTSQVVNVLPLVNGGTGSSAKNFVDLTTAQTVAGGKTFTGVMAVTATPGIGTPVLSISGNSSADSGTQITGMVSQTVAQTGSAGYTSLLINTTENSTGSGAKLLLDAQIGGSSKFSVSNTGTVSLSGKIINLTDPSNLQDAATKNYVDTRLTATGSNYVLKSGDTMSSTLNIKTDTVPGLSLQRDTTGGFNSISFKTSTGTQMGFFESNASTAEMKFAADGGSSIGFLTFATRTAGVITERMRIANNGTIGIGTSAPTHNLTLPSGSNGIALYNTVDQATNYERVVMSWSANKFNINPEYAGTGSFRGISFTGAGPADPSNQMVYIRNTGGTNGNYISLRVDGYSVLGNIRVNGADTQRSFFSSTGTELGFGTHAADVSFSTDTNGTTRMVVIKATTGRVGIGITSPSAPLHVTNTFSSASGTDYGVMFTPTYAQTGTAGYTAMLVRATETSTGSGTRLLLDAQTGSTSKFSVDNTGLVTVSGKIANLTDPTNAQDAATKNYVDTTATAGVAAKVSKAGDTMTGTLNITAPDATMLLRGTGNLNYSGVNMYNDNNSLAGSFQVGNTNIAQTHLRNNLFIGARLAGGQLVFVQGTGVNEIARFNASGYLGLATTTPSHTLSMSATATGIAQYNTTDEATNYERFRSYWSGGVLNLRTEKGGTGTVRNMTVGTANNTLTFQDTLTGSGIFLFSASTTVNTIPLHNIAGSLSSANGAQTMSAISPTIAQTSTAGYTALLINPTETTTGSGAKNLIDAQVGGNSKFSVDNSGNVKLAVAGAGTYVKEGANATMGVATLAAGTVAVATSKITANSRVFLTVQSLGTITTPAAVAVTSRVAGASFTVTSSQATDSSVVAWRIMEPA